jgi:hypothetical protein
VRLSCNAMHQTLAVFHEKGLNHIALFGYLGDPQITAGSAKT